MCELSPSRGEIWWVNFEPALGSEARKTRPALVVSSLAFEHLRVRVIVPLTTWQGRFARQANKFFIARSDANGLDSRLSRGCPAAPRHLARTGHRPHQRA
ncbi:MAG: type II toxin-antitoxin system PemK/MazF family toxin [Chloroflexota bacterium]